MDGDIDKFDARFFEWEAAEITDPFKTMFMYSPKVNEFKKALHITKRGMFSSSNSKVADAIVDRENDAAHVYTELLAQ